MIIGLHWIVLSSSSLYPFAQFLLPRLQVPISISRIAKGLQMGLGIVVYMFVLSMVHSLHKGTHRFLFYVILQGSYFCIIDCIRIAWGLRIAMLPTNHFINVTQPYLDLLLQVLSCTQISILIQHVMLTIGLLFRYCGLHGDCGLQ